MDRRSLLDQLASTNEELGARFELSEADLAKQYGVGKWNVRQLLAHLTDCEFINLWRFCRAVAEPGSAVAPFEVDEWAVQLGYERRPREALALLFRGARETLLDYVENLPDEVLSRSCKHPEKGALDGWTWAELAIGHTRHHLSQIDAATRGVPWVKPVIANAGRFGA